MGYTVVSIVEVEVDLKAGMSQVCSPVRQTHVNNTTLEPKARNILFDSSIELNGGLSALITGLQVFLSSVGLDQ